MDLQISKKCKAVKLLEKARGNLRNLGVGDEPLDKIPKVWSMNEKIFEELDIIKIKTFVLWKTMFKDYKDKPQIGRTSL